MKIKIKRIITTIAEGLGLLLLIILSVAIMILLVDSMAKDIKNDITKERQKYEKYIGQEYVINKDTAIIVDYSVVGETFTLSNGLKINYKLMKTRMMK